MTKIKFLQKPQTDLVLESAYQLLGKNIAKLLKNTSITPNQVTLTKIPIGILLILLANSNRLVELALTIILWKVLDKTDGALARIKKRETKFGAWLDMFLDRILWGIMLFSVSLITAKQLNNNYPWLILSAIFFTAFIFNNLTFINLEEITKWKKEKNFFKDKLPGFFYQSIFSFYYLFDQFTALSLLLYNPIKAFSNLNIIHINLIIYLSFFTLSILFICLRNYQKLIKQ